MTSIKFAVPVESDGVKALVAQQRAAFDVSKAEAAARGVDLMEDRIQRYVQRWKECLAFVPDQGRVLDIGCGWMAPELFSMLIESAKLDYHAFDIDPVVIDDITERAASCGLPKDNFRSGEISQLPFDKTFDMVFSSHCLEHSVDITATLKEIHRVLRDGSWLFMAVPLGFDLSDEHVLTLGPDEWCAMLAAAGFEVITTSVGISYVECADITILARRSDAVQVDWSLARDIATRFSKVGSRLISHRAKEFEFLAPVIRNELESIVAGVGAACSISLPSPPLALVVVRHRWSGCLRVSDGTRTLYFDAYHHVHHLATIDLTGFARDIKVEVVAKNPLAFSAQAVLVGALVLDH